MADNQEAILLALQNSRHEPVPEMIKKLRAAWDESWQWQGGLKSRDIELLSQILEEAVKDYKTAAAAPEKDDAAKEAIKNLVELIKLGVCGYTDIVRSEVQQHSNDTYSVFSMLQVGPSCTKEHFNKMTEEEKKMWERLMTTARKNIYDDGRIATFQDALANQIGNALRSDLCPEGETPKWPSVLDIRFSRIRYNAIDSDGSMFIPFEVEYKNEDGKSMTATEELMARVKSEILENEVRLKKISEDGNILRVLQMDDKHYGDQKAKGSMKSLSADNKLPQLPVEKCDDEYTFVDPPATVKAAQHLLPIQEAAVALPDDEILQCCIVSLIRWLASWSKTNEMVLSVLKSKEEGKTSILEIVKSAVAKHQKREGVTHQLQMHTRIALKILLPDETQYSSAPVVYRSVTLMENVRLCTFSQTLQDLIDGKAPAAADGEGAGAEAEGSDAEASEELVIFGVKVSNPKAMRENPIQLQQFLSKKKVQLALPFCLLKQKLAVPLAAAPLAAMSPEEQVAALAAMSPEDRAGALAAMSPEDRAAALAAMSPEDGAAALAAMSLPFDPNVENYVTEVASTVVAFAIVAEAMDPGAASIAVNDEKMTSESTSQRIPINFGETVQVTLVVTAQDNESTQIYTIQVTRIDEAEEKKRKKKEIEDKKEKLRERHNKKERERLKSTDIKRE